MDRATWEKLHPWLDPLRPAGDPRDPTRVERVERPYSPLDDMLEELRLPFGLRKELLYGPPGSGKTTELLALLEPLSDKHLAVYLDLRAHFEDQRGDANALDHLQPWEVLGVVGLAVYRAAREHLGHTFPTKVESAFAEALAAPAGQPSTTLDVARISKEVALVVAAPADLALPGAGLALRSLAAVAAGISSALPMGLPGRSPIPDADDRIKNLKRAVDGLLDDVFTQYDRRRVLLVVDGLDRAGRETIARLFVTSQLLVELPCHQVWTAPLDLPTNNVRGVAPRGMHNLPVLDPADPSSPGPGVDFFRTMWTSRARAAGVSAEAISMRHLERLAWASGGLVREHLHMLQDTIERAWTDDSPVTDAHIESVLGKWRERWVWGLGSASRDALRRVRERRIFDDTSDLDLRLLSEKCIVAYPNGSIWYWPHPLLQRFLDGE